MVTSLQLSVEPCLIVDEWSEMLSHSSSFYSPSRCTIWYLSSNQYTVSFPKSVHFSASLLENPSRCAIGHFPSTIVINSNAFRCSTLFTSFGPDCFIIVAFPCRVMFLLLKILPHTYVEVAGSMVNDRLITITTSYGVVLVVVERGVLIRSSAIPSPSFSRRYSEYGELS